MSTEEIENILRQAPKPEPPAGLKERLASQIELTVARSGSASLARSGGWLRRWWPVVSPATLSLACAVVFTMQQMELHDLKQAVAALPQISTPGSSSEKAGLSEATTPAARLGETEEQEIARLKEMASNLSAKLAQLEQLRADNDKLRTQLAALPDRLTAEETADLTKARDNAQAVHCVNNLKQLGLAVRVWAIDNGETNAPDILSMTNEISTPKVLYCPSDNAHQAAENWASYTSANCSYEYLAPSAALADREPQRVLFRCPIHGSIGLCDGSVQKSIAKEHPDWLIERQGKLYFEPPQTTNPASAEQPGAEPDRSQK